MGKVFEDFVAIFSPRTTVYEPPPEADTTDAEMRVASVRDMRVFIGTQAYRDFRLWLDREIDTMSPDPRMGSDVASCYTFKREGLIASRRRLDAMVTLAEEKLSNG